MADAEANVYAALTGYAGLTALVNNGDSPLTYRIYPLVMPQDPTVPAVVYQRIVGSRILTMSNAGGSGVERIVFQFTTWSRTMNEAHDVMEQVRLALNAANFAAIPLSNRTTHEPDTRLYGMEYDFSVWHRP